MANTYVKIATATAPLLGSTTFDFTSIPATYTDLLIKLSGRSSAAAATDNARINFNGATSYFSYIRLSGDGVNATSGKQVVADVTATSFLGAISAATATTSTFSNTEIYMPNYTSSAKKSFSTDAVTENNTTTITLGDNLLAALWEGTSTISSIKLSLDSGNFVQYSTATLYGILKS